MLDETESTDQFTEPDEKESVDEFKPDEQVSVPRWMCQNINNNNNCTWL